MVFLLKRAARHLLSFWVLSLELTLSRVFNIDELYIGAMDAVCVEMLLTSLSYIRGQKHYRNLRLAGVIRKARRRSFEEAYVEFPSRWDLHATVVESEIERELPDTYQTNAK